MSSTPGMPLRERLRTALVAALKARDAAAVSALRLALGAIDNAEAVEQRVQPEAGSVIAGAVAGLGAGDVPRRVLSEAEITTIVGAVILDLRSAAEQYQRLGETEAAARARSQAEVVATQVATSC